MDISLTPQLEEWIREKVEAGLYKNESEVICAALRVMQVQAEIRQQRLERLSDKLAEGDADLSAGRSAIFSNEDEVRTLFSRF